MIRKATASDLDAIELIYNRIHEEESRGSMTIGWRKGIYPVRQTAADALTRNDFFVEETNGTIVASAVINQQQVPEYANCTWTYNVPDDKVMVLHTLTVDPSIKGKGFGHAFVDFYEAYAKEQGCQVLRIDTQSKNAAARSFYHHLGFSEAGIVYCTFNGIPDVELVCLEKYISDDSSANEQSFVLT